ITQSSAPYVKLFHVGNEKLRTVATGVQITGGIINDDGYVQIKRTGNAPIIADRLGTTGSSGTSRGEIFNFKSAGTKVGEIGYQNPYGGILYMAHGNTAGFGIGFYQFSTSRYIQPCDQDGGIRDNEVDVGSTASRFDDVYATNGTIQTSDRNEKQDIQALTTAEQAAAVACKALVRRFRWVDSVEEKGDNARYHFGVIAQDVEAAFTAQGLDAGRYGLFIRTNWWEHENTWYPSEEAAPEGAVERSRLGIRYNQLLAFIISAL
ncbi:MAG: tail fiber domain-containing protein, partial [Bacteroidia bacterium]